MPGHRSAGSSCGDNIFRAREPLLDGHGLGTSTASHLGDEADQLLALPFTEQQQHIAAGFNLFGLKTARQTMADRRHLNMHEAPIRLASLTDNDATLFEPIQCR